MSNQRPDKNIIKKDHLKWTDRMDRAFIEAMLTQQDKGNRINGTFTSQAYANMVDKLNAKLDMNLSKNNLKNRLKSLESSFSQWYDMFRGSSLSGFAWNSETQLIEADEEVWENLINSKPEAILLKTKKVANYDDLMLLFAADRATGAHAETTKEKSARLSNAMDIKIETIAEVDDLLASNDITLENQHKHGHDDEVQVLSPTYVAHEQNQVQNSSAKKGKSKKRKVEDEDEDESFETKIMNVVGDMANAMREGNKIFERAYHREYNGEEIYKELAPMGLEPQEIPSALMYLARNQADARILFSSPVNIRVNLLKNNDGCEEVSHLGL